MSSSNLQYVTSITFLISTYAKYMISSNHTFNCNNILVTSNILRTLAKKQVNFICLISLFFFFFFFFSHQSII
ncbi:putative cellulase [Dioscorea sansibarensis]